MTRKRYPSDLTDDQWEMIKSIVLENNPYTKGPKVSLESYREIINAIFYINKTGAPWDYLPRDFPPKTTVHTHYMNFCENGTFEKINDTLREEARARSRSKKKRKPSAGVIDSQSVKSAPEAKGNEVDFDGGKLVRGRKSGILVDTMGNLISVIVHRAKEYDGRAGIRLVKKAFQKGILKKIWADNSYKGGFVDYLKKFYNCDVEIKSSSWGKGFIPMKKRWVVERTFAWMTRTRRLVRIYEATIKSSETMVYISSVRLLLKKLSH